MWIITPHGYVSAVEHRTMRKTVLVRARDRKSIEHIAKIIEAADTDIVENAKADYPYRIHMWKWELKNYLDWSVDDITYDNFKNEATSTTPG
jgi:hypothetical protein